MSGHEQEVASPQPEKKGFEFPGTLTVLVLVTLLVWIAAFFIPAGAYQLHPGRCLPA